MVSRDAPRFSCSVRASLAVAERAPMVWVAICGVSPARRRSSYRPCRARSSTSKVVCSRRDRVVHQRQRLVVGVAQALDPGDLGAGGQSECGGDLVGRRDDAQVQHDRARHAVRGAQVVIEARKLERPADLGVDDLRTDAALAYEHSALDQVLDGAPGGGPGDAQPFGEIHLVLDAASDADLALLDQLLQARGDLEVQGDRTGAVDLDGPDGASWGGEIRCHIAPLRSQDLLSLS